jgi:hypothetical protein
VIKGNAGTRPRSTEAVRRTTRSSRNSRRTPEAQKLRDKMQRQDKAEGDRKYAFADPLVAQPAVSLRPMDNTGTVGIFRACYIRHPSGAT